MRLAMVKDGRLLRYKGGMYTIDTSYRFVSHLAKFVEAVDLYAVLTDVGDENDISGHPQVTFPENVRVVPTYYYRSVVDYYRNLPGILRNNWRLFKSGFAEADAVFLSLPSTNSIPAYEAARKAGTPVVTEVVGYQGSVVAKGDRYRGALRWAAWTVSLIHNRLFERILSGSREVFFLGTELRNAYRTGGASSHITFLSLVEDADIIGREDFFPEGELRLVYVGRLSHEKGLYHLLDAIPSIRDNTDKRVSLTLCGSGPEMDGLKQKASSMGLSDMVRFRGFVSMGEELNRELDGSDILILPSVSEGIPKVLIEGMARGVPVIASRVGGIPDIVADGVNGILIEAQSPGAIVDAVRGLAADPTLMRRLSDGGAAFAREHTADRQAAFMADRIREAAGGGR